MEGLDNDSLDWKPGQGGVQERKLRSASLIKSRLLRCAVLRA